MAKTNNVLILGPPRSGKIRIAQHITKDLDTSTIEAESHSGLKYNHNLQTKYFSLNVSLLIEEYPDSRYSRDSVVSLLRSFLAELEYPEFSELREALDGLILTIDVTADTETISLLLGLFLNITDLLEDNDIFVVVVGVADVHQELRLDAVADEVVSHGFEFVNFNEQGKNEYMEKLGKDRLVEILETHEWSQTEKPMSEETFTKHNTGKLAPMAETLIPKDGDSYGKDNTTPVDLDTLLAKLKRDKMRAEGMSEEEKKRFVDDLVDSYMEYF